MGLLWGKILIDSLMDFVVLEGEGPYTTPSHDSSHALPTSQIHLIRWKEPPIFSPSYIRYPRSDGEI